MTKENFRISLQEVKQFIEESRQREFQYKLNELGESADLSDILKISTREGTLIHFAVLEKKVDILNYLTNELPEDQKINVINAKDKYGDTALHKAALNDYTEIVKLLLDKGADLNTKDNDGSTPLYDAALNSHTEIVRLLLEKGADPNIKNSNDGWTALYWAAWKDHTEIVKLLLDKGADLNIKDINGWTPLHLAGFGGCIKIVKLLLEVGVELNQKNSLGLTPLHYAANYNHPKIVKLLLEAKADPDLKDINGSTPLYDAVLNRHTEIVKLLLEAEANPNTQNRYGWSALSRAALNGYTEIVRLLLEKGADPNIKNSNDGWTALYWAAQNGHTDIVKLLLGKSVDLTPLSLIISGPHKDKFVELIQSNFILAVLLKHSLGNIRLAGKNPVLGELCLYTSLEVYYQLLINDFGKNLIDNFIGQSKEKVITRIADYLFYTKEVTNAIEESSVFVADPTPRIGESARNR